jgi:ABC-type polysaccharide/polyol phosphate transport system ATPase subunit
LIFQRGVSIQAQRVISSIIDAGFNLMVAAAPTPHGPLRPKSFDVVYPLRPEPRVQGIPAEEIPERREEIAAFTELEEYLDLHVGAYSSGMRVRLAFAISTALDPDILIIDEVFGAGDAAFMKKAETRMESLIDRSSILVFASHSPSLAERFCERGIWLDGGEIRQSGPIKEVTHAYLASVV